MNSNNLLTRSMVQSPSWEANWFAASQEIPAFHRTQRFITALTSVHHLSLSWTSPIQSTYPHPTSWRSSLILSTHLRLGLPSGLFPYGFPTKTLHTPLSSPIRATCPAHLILLDFITRTILDLINYYKRYHKILSAVIKEAKKLNYTDKIKKILKQEQNYLGYSKLRNQ